MEMHVPLMYHDSASAQVMTHRMPYAGYCRRCDEQQATAPIAALIFSFLVFEHKIFVPEGPAPVSSLDTRVI